MDPEEIKRKLKEAAEREKKAAEEKKELEEALKKAEEESKKKAEDEYRGQLRKLEELHAKALQKTGEYEKRIRESYLQQHHLEMQIEYLRKKLNGPPSTTPFRQRTSAKAASSSPRKVTGDELQHAISRIQSTSKPPLKMKISVKKMKPILEENFEDDGVELFGELKLDPQCQKEAEETKQKVTVGDVEGIPKEATLIGEGEEWRCGRCFKPQPFGKNLNSNFIKNDGHKIRCEQWPIEKIVAIRLKNGWKKGGGVEKKRKNDDGKDDVEVKRKKKDEDEGEGGKKKMKKGKNEGEVDGPKGELKKLVTVLGTPVHIIGDFDKRISRSQRREQENEERKKKAAVVMERVRRENEEKKKKIGGGIQFNNAKADLEQINRLENEEKLIEKKSKNAGTEEDLDKFFKTPIRNVPSNLLPDNFPVDSRPEKALPTMRARPGGYIWKQGQEESDKEEDRLIIDEGEDEEMEDEEEEVPKKKKNAYSGPCFENGYSPYDPNWSSDEDDGEGGQIEVVEG